ncbi:porin family protein [Persicimonas caeni]|nr:porin family protein [Persicimonas caeni]
MKSMMHIKLLALAAVLTLAPATAFSQQMGTPPEDEQPAATETETDTETDTEPEAQPAEGEEMAEPMAEDEAVEPMADEDATVGAEMEVGADDELIYQQGGLSGLGLVIGAKVGGGFPQLTSEFDTTFTGELELGYTLPVLDRSIEVFLSGQYAAPSSEETEAGPDERLPGDGTWSYEATMHQVVLTLGGLYRLDVGSDLVVPYGALGGRMYLWQTDVDGEADGQPFGEYEEQDTDFGGYAALGADFFLGPGSLLVEVQFGYASVDNFILRDTDTGSLNAVIGYRMFL